MAKKKQSFADTLEAAIREQYLPSQLSAILGEILNIEFNADWRKTPEGIKDAQDNSGFTLDDLAKVLIKQDAHKEQLTIKKDFIKRMIDQS